MVSLSNSQKKIGQSYFIKGLLYHFTTKAWGYWSDSGTYGQFYMNLCTMGWCGCSFHTLKFYKALLIKIWNCTCRNLIQNIYLSSKWSIWMLWTLLSYYGIFQLNDFIQMWEVNVIKNIFPFLQQKNISISFSF